MGTGPRVYGWSKEVAIIWRSCINEQKIRANPHETHFIYLFINSLTSHPKNFTGHLLGTIVGPWIWVKNHVLTLKKLMIKAANLLCTQVGLPRKSKYWQQKPVFSGFSGLFYLPFQIHSPSLSTPLYHESLNTSDYTPLGFWYSGFQFGQCQAPAGDWGRKMSEGVVFITFAVGLSWAGFVQGQEFSEEVHSTQPSLFSGSLFPLSIPSDLLWQLDFKTL